VLESGVRECLTLGNFWRVFVFLHLLPIAGRAEGTSKFN